MFTVRNNISEIHNYDLDNGLIFEVTKETDRNGVESWNGYIYTENGTIKMFVYGEPVCRTRYSRETTLEEFLENAEIAIFNGDYEEYLDCVEYYRAGL